MSQHRKYVIDGQRPDSIIEEVAQICGMLEDEAKEHLDRAQTDTIVFQRQGNSIVVFGYNTGEVELSAEDVQRHIPRASDLDALFTDDFKSDEPPLSWN